MLSPASASLHGGQRWGCSCFPPPEGRGDVLLREKGDFPAALKPNDLSAILYGLSLGSFSN